MRLRVRFARGRHPGFSLRAAPAPPCLRAFSRSGHFWPVAPGQKKPKQGAFLVGVGGKHVRGTDKIIRLARLPAGSRAASAGAGAGQNRGARPPADAVRAHPAAAEGRGGARCAAWGWVKNPTGCRNPPPRAVVVEPRIDSGQTQQSCHQPPNRSRHFLPFVPLPTGLRKYHCGGSADVYCHEKVVRPAKLSRLRRLPEDRTIIANAVP